MSRYTFPGKAPQYHLIVGVDTEVPLPTFFGQVIETPLGFSPLEKTDPLVSVGSAPPLRDLQQIVAALKPYGTIPLTLQLQLLEELDAHTPFPIRALGQQLAAICQQAPGSRLAETADAHERIFLVLTAQGWQKHPWPGDGHFPDAFVARMLFPQQQAQLDYLSGYTSDPSIIFALHGNGMNLFLPVLTIFTRGVALCGPVAISNEDAGLTAKQVQLVQQEVLWVPHELRSWVTVLWYRAWATIASRGW